MTQFPDGRKTFAADIIVLIHNLQQVENEADTTQAEMLMKDTNIDEHVQD